MSALAPTQPRADARLSLEGVSKRFGGVTAVESISIDVPEGRILSIIGPNGAGKTSLLNMISGFYRPDTGTITLRGQRDITGSRPAEVASARHRPHLPEHRAVQRHDGARQHHARPSCAHEGRRVVLRFIYWGLAAHKEEVAHRGRVEELIEFLELEDLRKQPTSALAYGLASASSSAARWPSTPRSCFSTSRWAA